MLCKDCKKRDKCVAPCPRLSKLLEKEFVHGREMLFTEIEKETEGGRTFGPLDRRPEKGLLHASDVQHVLKDKVGSVKLTEAQQKILEYFNNGLSYKKVARAVSGRRGSFNEKKIKNQLHQIRKKTKAVEKVD